jgi:hypothetical protein
MNKKYKCLEGYESNNLTLVIDRANAFINRWSIYDTEIEVNVNRHTGEYYFLGKVFA